MEEKIKEIDVQKGVKIGLKKPVKYENTEIKELNIDLMSLTGKDMCEAEENFRATFTIQIGNPNYSQAYHAAVLAQAVKLPYEVILEFDAEDFVLLVGLVEGFLGAQALKRQKTLETLGLLS